MNRPRRSPKPTSPLASTELAVTITDLVAEYVVRHRFRNDGKEACRNGLLLPGALRVADRSPLQRRGWRVSSAMLHQPPFHVLVQEAGNKRLIGQALTQRALLEQAQIFG